MQWLTLARKSFRKVNATYEDHLKTLSSEWNELLVRNGFDGALIAAGESSFYFEDDQSPTFHANPHFLRWSVFDECEHCVLVVNAESEPQLHWYTPADYWYLPTSIPKRLASNFDHQVHTTLEDLDRACKTAVQGNQRIAYIGPEPCAQLSLSNVEPAPEKLLNQLAFRRAFKTPFEIACMANATAIGVQGHLAAREAFFNNGCEFDIHLAYLKASKQVESQLPYPNIVGLNEHASTLHYQHYALSPPSTIRSLLIDAGAKYQSYHADITRSYARIEGNEYDELVSTVNDFQLQLISELPSFDTFLDFHVRAHQLVAQALVDCRVVKCSATATYDQQLTDVFYPHGTGHLLGLQTHDVGGHITDEIGNSVSPPERFPSLRLLRKISPNMVFTVEPGIYLIPILLKSVAGHPDINWSKVEELLPFGGVRIEDNVAVEEDGVLNLTRQAFQAAE
ncbi:MAG: Xaa-Pro dipeptidase [Gammaproteobacteria bacterium]|nr:Xaa-Pro dipeptidase [Gammaproteobacteria bacterium]